MEINWKSSSHASLHASARFDEWLQRGGVGCAVLWTGVGIHELPRSLAPETPDEITGEGLDDYGVLLTCVFILPPPAVKSRGDKCDEASEAPETRELVVRKQEAARIPIYLELGTVF